MLDTGPPLAEPPGSTDLALESPESSGFGQVCTHPVSLPQAYSLLWKFSEGFRWKIVLAALLALAVATLTVLGPALTARFFQVFEPTDAGAVSPVAGGTAAAQNPGLLSRRIALLQIGGKDYFLTTPAMVLGLAALATLAAAIVGIFHARVQESARQGLIRRVKQELYSHIHRTHVLDPQRPAGELITLIGQAEGTIGLYSILFISPLSIGWQLVFAVFMMAAASWWLTLTYLVLSVLINLVFPRLLGLDRRVNEASARIVDSSVAEQNVLVEQLNARDLIEALGVQSAAEKRANERFLDIGAKTVRMVLAVQYRGLSSVLAGIMFPVLVFLGATFSTNLSNILQVWMLSGAVTGAMQGLISLYTSWIQSQPTLAFVNSELDRPVPPVASEPLFAGAPSLRLQNVEADLPDGKALLRGINLDVPRGKLIAIVGRGGTGKSVLLDVVAGRFRGAVRGEVRFNDTTIPCDRLIEYRGQIPRLNQTPQMFRMAIADFVLFGCTGAPRRSVEDVLDMVGLGASAPAERRLMSQDVIAVTRRLSGLQQQCLRLAQLLVRPRAGLILLDEPDSAMSPEDAACVQRVIIEALTPESTVLMVTHAPHLLPEDTTIAFLKDGQVAGTGTHRELSAAVPAYRQLVHDLAMEAAKPAEGEVLSPAENAELAS